MADIAAALQNFINSEIALSQADINSSVKSREWLVTKVVDKIKENGELYLHSKVPFIYFGSYFKGTKVSKADEFDVLLLIDSNTGVYRAGNNEIGTGIGEASPNPKYTSDFYFEDGSSISPAKMLNWLKRTILEVTKEFGGEAPERGGEAVTALIKSKGIKIDFVPAGVFKYNANPTNLFFNIPAGDRFGNWKITNPNKDAELLKSTADGRTNLKNVIRLIKFIKEKDQYNMAISSYAVECAVVRYAQKETWYQNLRTDFIGTLLFLYDQMKAKSLLDPFDGSTNLFSSVENIDWYADRILEIAKTIHECKDEINQDVAYAKISKCLKNK